MKLLVTNKVLIELANNNESLVLNLADEEGSQIRATAWGENILLIDQMVEVSLFYYKKSQKTEK